MIDELVSLFKLYPDVFPSGYFRYLKTNLQQSIAKETYIYRDGVLLTYKRYSRSHPPALKGDYLLDKLVSKEPGNGKAQEVLSEFLLVKDASNCYLKVKATNARAIAFYQRNGFRIIKYTEPYYLMHLKSRYLNW